MAIALQREEPLNGSLWRALRDASALFLKLKIPRISARSFRLLSALGDLTLNARQAPQNRINYSHIRSRVIIPRRRPRLVAVHPNRRSLARTRVRVLARRTRTAYRSLAEVTEPTGVSSSRY